MRKKIGGKRIFYIVMTILIAIVIFLSSSISTVAGEKTGVNLATFYHFGVFFMFTFFLSLSLINKKIDFKLTIIILLIALIYSISDEFHQLFVMGRFASIKDIFIDIVGSIYAVVMLKTVEVININKP